MLDVLATETGRTVRYALASNSRTARLGLLMTLYAVIYYWLVML